VKRSLIFSPWLLFSKNVLYKNTVFNKVQSCHMYRSTVHWLYDKLELQCYAFYRMVLNPFHWTGISWRYNQNYDSMEVEKCLRYDFIVMCLKVNNYALKFDWLDLSACHWIIWWEVHLIYIDFMQRIMMYTNASLCSVKSHLCWSLVVIISCTLIVSVES
jgi:hypothetical protein